MAMSRDGDKGDYLWDRSGAADAETSELERLLGRYAHSGAEFEAAGRAASGGSSPGGSAAGGGGRRALGYSPRARWIATLAAVAIVGLTAYFWGFGTATDNALRLRDGGIALADGDWVRLGKEPDRVLQLGRAGQEPLGELRLDAGTRLQLVHLRDDEILLNLKYGTIKASVAGSVQPRFFQVDTPSGRCIDLGCRYTLRVRGPGDAYVTVEEGEIEFRLADRDVFVPAGAYCSSDPERGPGTPAFADADPDFRKVLKAFDAESDVDRRNDYVEKMTYAATTDRETLSLWHLLQDPDPRIRKKAERSLMQIAGHPAGEIKGYTPASVEDWFQHLHPRW